MYSTPLLKGFERNSFPGIDRDKHQNDWNLCPAVAQKEILAKSITL
jgi:hypothetical protein